MLQLSGGRRNRDAGGDAGPWGYDLLSRRLPGSQLRERRIDCPLCAVAHSVA